VLEWLFLKPKRQISAEQFGGILAGIAQDAEKDIAALSAQILGMSHNTKRFKKRMVA
jgi:hypothetical protein